MNKNRDLEYQAKKLLEDYVPMRRKENPNRDDYYDEMEADLKWDIKRFEDYRNSVKNLMSRVDTNRHFYEVEIPDPWFADTPTWWNYIEEWDKPSKSFIDTVVEKIPYDRWWEEVFFEDQVKEIKQKWNIKEILRDRLERSETYRVPKCQIVGLRYLW